MNFSLDTAVKAKESAGSLTPGIKDVVFKGVEFTKVTSQKTGDDYKALSLKLDVDGYGEYTQNFFEPQSNERKDGQYGVQPSPLDHFLIIVREILEAVCPEVVKQINDGTLQVGGTFKQMVDKVSELTKEGIGKRMQAKFIPQSNGYSQMPGFPAGISRSGELRISSRIIGENLAFTSSEQKRIDAAANAKPTNMKKSVDNDLLSDMADSINAELEDKSDDLPF